MKKIAVLALSLVMMLSLAACGAEAEQADAPASGAEQTASSAEQTDAVTTPSTTTGLYTNLDMDQLMEKISAYAGVSVVSTVNSDGTPNIAIATPGTAGDGEHIVFNLMPNATKSNIQRTKMAMMAFDIPNTAAETKAERHTGAVLKLELEEDQDVIAALAENNDFISDVSLVLKVTELRPVG